MLSFSSFIVAAFILSFRGALAYNWESGAPRIS
jgi:hypothetical protein